MTVCFLQGRGEQFRQHEHVKHTQDSDQEQGGSVKGGRKGGKLSKTLEKANQLMEVKAALEQLSIENSVQSSVSHSMYSSLSEDSEAEAGGEERLSRKEREASHETLSTTVTSADEVVWIDSHNR